MLVLLRTCTPHTPSPPSESRSASLRATILIALLDGKARTAGELALTADVSAQSASAHLSKLVNGGLLTASRTGRHRYYAMAGPDVAHAHEALGSISTLPRARQLCNFLRRTAPALSWVRCYASEACPARSARLTIFSALRRRAFRHLSSH